MRTGSARAETARIKVAALLAMIGAIAAPIGGQTRRLARVPAPVGPSGQVQELYTGSHALLVGVARYEAAAAWTPLDSVPSELNELETGLRAIGFETVQHVTNPTGVELRRAVETFIGQHGYDPGNRLLLFFAGHGYTLDDGERGYFVPRDAPDPTTDERGFRRVALSMQQVATWAQELTARHALFAFDSCFSGTIFRTRERAVPQRIAALTAAPVRQFLSAGSAGEPVPARSVFTPVMVRGLKGAADLDGDGFVTGTELGNYVQREVIAYKTGQTPQFGKIRDVRLDQGDIVFTSAASSAPVSSAHPAPSPSPAPTDDEGRFWDGVVAQRGQPGERRLLAAYIDRYGAGGRFTVIARERLWALDAVPPTRPASIPDTLRADWDRCERGEGDRCNELGVAYATGRGVATSVALAVSLYRKACDLGAPPGCSNLGYRYLNGIVVAKDETRAVSLYEQACDAQYLWGCVNLGAMYWNGLGVPQDDKLAVSLYRKGCDGSNAEGCRRLGIAYASGRGVARDDQLAASLYRKACDGNDEWGCLNLGVMYWNAVGVAKDEALAVSLYRKGCDANNALGCSWLGYAYASGRGVARDDKLAASLYRKACDGNDEWGCVSLGILHWNALGVPKDEALAVTLYRKGCDGNNAEGCRRLGIAYASGRGVARDDKLAVSLYRKACDGNDEWGCHNLGTMYHDGLGELPRDLMRARELYERACGAKIENACSSLGLLYARGEAGLAVDPAKASELLQRGCDGGNAWGCVRLAELYENGGVVTADRARALALYRKACVMKDDDACAAMKRLTGQP